MTFRPVEATLFLEKTEAPDADNDQNDGYLVGDIWVDETNDAAYLNLDITVGAAVWKHISLEEAAIDHTAILNIGTTTHTDIDTHIGDTTIHFDQVGELSDVVISGPADNDLLQYDNVTSKWVDRTLAEAGVSATGHTHDDRYFTETEHLDASAGAGDAGKPVKLDAAGHIDTTMIDDGDIDHTLIGSIGTNTHADIDTHIADGTKHFLEGAIDHLNILSIGTNSHAAVDIHIADGTKHFLEGAIDHTAILNIGTNSHADIDTHIADGTRHFLEGSIDHGSISGLGDSADHAWALLINGSRSLTGDWDIGDGRYIAADEIRARDAAGLYLRDDSGTLGIFVEDGGQVGIGTAAPVVKFDVDGTGGADSMIRVTYNAHAQGARIFVQTNKAGVLALSNTDASGDAITLTGDPASDSFINAGKFGIGTNAPLGKLTIADDTNIVGGSTPDIIFMGTVQSGDAILYTTGKIYSNFDSDVYSGARLTLAYPTGANTWGDGLSLIDGDIGIGTIAPSAKLDINSDILRLRTAKTPASAGAAGDTGDICWDATYLYICVAANTWERVQHDSW